MWLVAFSARGYHAVPLPIMTGWLTCLLVFCDGFLRWACSRWPSRIFLFSWRRICCEYLQVWKSFLGIFVSPIWVCLDYLESISLSSVCSNVSGIVRILFSCVLDWLEFAVLVIFVFRLGSKLPCLFSLLFYCLVDPVPFCFLQTPCRFFSCFVWCILICWQLTLFARSLMSDVCFISIELMYIDVVPDVVIWTVNWLHYLNC